MNTVFRLTGFLKAYPWRVAGAILLGIGTIFAGIGLLSSSGYLISEAALQPPILDLMVLIVAVRFFGLSRAALRYAERLLSHDVTFRLLMNMRSYFFRALTALPASRLLGYQSGSLLSSLTSDIDELQNFYVRVFSPVIVAVIVILAVFYFLSYFSTTAAAATLVMLSLNATAVPVLVRSLASGYGKKQMELRSKLNQHWVESCQLMKEARLFGKLGAQNQETERLSRELAEVERKQAFITGLQDSLSNWMQYAAVFLALIIVVPLVIIGSLSGVMVALVLLAVMASFEATQNLGTAFQYLESSEKSASNLMNLATQRSDSDETTHSDSTKLLTGPLQFDNVSFGYENTPVLKQVSFVAKRGRSTAVIGPTGCGKSTLVNLLMKFYEPGEGSIRIGDEPVDKLNPDLVRKSASVVDQHTYIFNDTLRNNLDFGAGFDDKKLMQVLEVAELGYWFKELPQGFDTILGEHGKNLSGGERQRLAIARAILKNTDIWILDEPTANLDTITEQSIMQTIRRITRDKTVLWITHRLVEMNRFDEIVVIQNGMVIQTGNHEELNNSKGWYRSMLELESDVISH